MCRTTLFMGLLAAIFSAGCSPALQTGKGFTLPEGDIEAGKTTYVALQCSACHTVSGVEQVVAEGEKPELSVALGGEVSRIKTYGELVTGIINPSHRLAQGYPTETVAAEGQSKMKNYNDEITVTQLIDLVAFLQSKYKLREYEPTYYPTYGY